VLRLPWPAANVSAMSTMRWVDLRYEAFAIPPVMVVVRCTTEHEPEQWGELQTVAPTSLQLAASRFRGRTSHLSLLADCAA
jgi:hypothetical protein